MQVKTVLCGGPCGGKTTSQNIIKESSLLNDYQLYQIEETATFLFELGYAPGENISSYDFQNLLLKLQFLKEYFIENKIKNDRGIIICDRGLLDGSAYMQPDDFTRLLKENGLEQKQISQTYDFAIYLESIAKTNPELFSILRKYETPEIGALRDDKSYKIWSNATKIIDLKEFALEDKALQAMQYIIDNYDNYSNQNTKLSDFYDHEHFNFIKSSAMEILKKNPPAYQDKQKQLMKQLSITEVQ